ncbi:MAG UNVERIFIED_CONTAM: DUF4870 domain-containing protein [Anaerolineae bacterium]|jgi:uncharacterized Tic20 family protein
MMEKPSVFRAYLLPRLASDETMTRAIIPLLPSPKSPSATPRSYSASNIGEDDRFWGEPLPTPACGLRWWRGFASAVAVVPFLVFVPLVIYLVFKERSPYIAFHALQAFCLQLLCTVGVVFAIVVGSIVYVLGIALGALLVVVLVGVVVLPLWIIVGALLLSALGIIPLIGLVYATLASYQIYQGQDYRYPYLANWVDSQIARGFTS